MAKSFPLPDGYDGLHRGHGNHLCVAHVMGYLQTNWREYKELVADSRYVCRNCGRAAHKAEHLCNPESL